VIYIGSWASENWELGSYAIETIFLVCTILRIGLLHCIAKAFGKMASKRSFHAEEGMLLGKLAGHLDILE